MLSEILQEILLTESVSTNEIDDAIDNHKRIIINYHSNGEDVATGARVIEVYAYGLTKAGNPVIRAFQPFGDTTSRVPSWKFFRLDRISAWKETNQKFSRPASEIYRGLGDFNPDDDRTMSTVYKIATFDDELQNDDSNKTNPKLKPEIFKTDTERNMERLKQQTDNPIKLSDIKTKDAFKNIKEPEKETGPKIKNDKENVTPYRTDTERNMERLRQQLESPRKIDLSSFNNKRKINTEDDKEIKDIEAKLGDTSNRIPMGDFNRRLANNQQPYRTDTERNMERLRQQLESPRKIDLDKIPKK